MKSEDRELLLKDLSARLPYGVIGTDGRHGDSRITEISVYPTNATDGETSVYYWNFDEYGCIEDCKPYLRLLSSMTEEEKKELKYVALVDNEGVPGDIPAYIDWLNQHHFDYRGLIEKGLAIVVTKENNPYEETNL